MVITRCPRRLAKPSFKFTTILTEMADGSITSRPYAGLPPNTAEDRKRARELYKYFKPPSRPAPIDTVLTAHSQLAAWRLNAERAMVSLIDEETQYFIAESTKTIHLDDAEKYEDPDDAIWAGVSLPFASGLPTEGCHVNNTYSVSEYQRPVDYVNTLLQHHRLLRADQLVLRYSI